VNARAILRDGLPVLLLPQQVPAVSRHEIAFGTARRSRCLRGMAISDVCHFDGTVHGAGGRVCPFAVARDGYFSRLLAESSSTVFKTPSGWQCCCRGRDWPFILCLGGGRETLQKTFFFLAVCCRVALLHDRGPATILFFPRARTGTWFVALTKTWDIPLWPAMVCGRSRSALLPHFTDNLTEVIAGVLDHSSPECRCMVIGTSQKKEKKKELLNHKGHTKEHKRNTRALPTGITRRNTEKELRNVLESGEMNFVRVSFISKHPQGRGAGRLRFPKD